MDECVYEWWRARESRASGKRRNYVIPGRYARHATDSNPVKRSPFGLCIPYVLPLSHLSQREIPQPERACRRNRRVSAGACARAWNRETMKIPPISAYLEILSFPAFFPFSPPFFFLFFFSYKRTRYHVECFPHDGERSGNLFAIWFADISKEGEIKRSSSREYLEEWHRANCEFFQNETKNFLELSRAFNHRRRNKFRKGNQSRSVGRIRDNSKTDEEEEERGK